MSQWQEGRREDPKPCREQDNGLFEITARDGQARLGRLHTQHGILETPALLPVINQNIRTIEPREMYDRYGIGALITNSYIIWKHEKLRSVAQSDGVHSLIDFPGVIMTDSGTFQSYIYGDVEVGVEEIVEFQKSIGVDIATMLDVFSRPDMTKTEVDQAVEETAARAQVSVEASGDVMLNGPIQGGLYKDLRSKSAKLMAKHDFSVHPIGGIVPVMEQHKYKDYAKILLASIPNLPANRPRHMFGCGHPMLFPMSIALGADLFDSAAYALFARDGRLLTPWGTEKIAELVDWPVLMPCVAYTSPEQVRKMDKEERTKILARYNLEVTLAELARCKQAVRDGTIWRLAERRSHQHPALREAWLWITTNPNRGGLSIDDLEEMVRDDRSAARDRDQTRGSWEDAWDWLVSSHESPRSGGVSWGGEDTFSRPHIVKARRNLHSRWHALEPQGEGAEHVLVIHGESGPWRDRCRELMLHIKHNAPGLEVFILTPVGLVPYSLEDMNPFAHIDGPKWLWRRRPDLLWIRRELDRLEISDRKIITFDMQGDHLKSRCLNLLAQEGIIGEQAIEGELDEEARKAAIHQVNARLVRDKMTVLLNTNPDSASELMQGASFVVNRHGRVKNALTAGGTHIVSPRLDTGGISLTTDGAVELASHRRRPLPKEIGQSEHWSHPGQGLPIVVVNDDAEPFVRKGRNVFHGFVIACDPWVSIDSACLIYSQSGELIGHGISQCSSEEFATLGKGVAVKTKGGIKE